VNLEAMSGPPHDNSAARQYGKRVERVIDHIRAHLDDELRLVDLAGVANFSPFHFHRVFKATTGETLFEFVQRLRIERAASALTALPDQSVLATALDHGFASAATFARAFRARFGMSATEWRAGGAQRWSRRRERERKHGKQVGKASKARGRSRRKTRRKEDAMSIQVREQPSYHVAYMRYVGPFGPRGIPELWARLHEWTAAHGLRGPTRTTLGIAYDDPSITAPDKTRYDACVVVPRDFEPDRLVEVMDVPAGTYAVADFVGSAHEIVAAWNAVFAGWLPTSGYEPDDRPCYELYRGDPTVDARRRTFRCDLCLPVRRL
jgi:AraC family transcriptional regulator